MHIIFLCVHLGVTKCNRKQCTPALKKPKGFNKRKNTDSDLGQTEKN